jgi:hypothetical protein
MVFSLNAFGKTKKIMRVGVYPLICVKGGINTADNLKRLLEENADIVKEGFEKAEAGYLYDGFMAEVQKGAIEETQLPKNQEIPWMAFKVGKKVKVVKDLVWGANKTLDVFSSTVEYNCKNYLLVIPKKCGNITLMDIKNTYATCSMTVSPAKVNIGDEITVDLSGSTCATKFEVTIFHEGNQIAFKEVTEPILKFKFDKSGNYKVTAKAFNVDGVASEGECEGKFSINYPPVCDLKVTPVKGYVGQAFKLDASGSTDKDGQVVKADFTIKDKAGAEVDKKTVTPPPLIWDLRFKKTGIYKIWLKVTDDFNAVSANNCEMEVKVRKRLFGLFEIGPMLAKGTYTGYVFARLGFSYLIVPERLSLIVSGGGALKLAGDRFKNHFLSNVLLNLHMKSLFVGAGLGYSTAVRDDWGGGIDAVGNIGFDIYDNGFNKKAAIFGEVRLALRKDLDISDAHELLLGFRYIF